MNTGTGYVGSLTPEQSETLETFRRIVFDELLPSCTTFSASDSETETETETESEAEADEPPTLCDSYRNRYRHHDRMLLRFLRARKFDVDKASKFLLDYFQWRVSFGVDSLRLEDLNKGLLQDTRIRFMGQDRVGRPTVVVYPGNHTPGSCDVDDMLRVMVFTLESITAWMPPEAEKLNIIIDYAGWGLRNVDSAVDRAILRMGSDCFPELLGTAFLLDAPWYFRGVWHVIKPLLDEETRRKVRMIRSGDSASVLSDFYEPNQLLAKFGGTLPSLRSIGELLDEIHQRPYGAHHPHMKSGMRDTPSAAVMDPATVGISPSEDPLQRDDSPPPSLDNQFNRISLDDAQPIGVAQVVV